MAAEVRVRKNNFIIYQVSHTGSSSKMHSHCQTMLQNTDGTPRRTLWEPSDKLSPGMNSLKEASLNNIMSLFYIYFTCNAKGTNKADVGTRTNCPRYLHIECVQQVRTDNR